MTFDTRERETTPEPTTRVNPEDMPEIDRYSQTAAWKDPIKGGLDYLRLALAANGKLRREHSQDDFDRSAPVNRHAVTALYRVFRNEKSGYYNFLLPVASDPEKFAEARAKIADDADRYEAAAFVASSLGALYSAPETYSWTLRDAFVRLRASFLDPEFTSARIGPYRENHPEAADLSDWQVRTRIIETYWSATDTLQMLAVTQKKLEDPMEMETPAHFAERCPGEIVQYQRSRPATAKLSKNEIARVILEERRPAAITRIVAHFSSESRKAAEMRNAFSFAKKALEDVRDGKDPIVPAKLTLSSTYPRI